MNKSSKFSKALSLLLAVVMLMGVMCVSMVAGAADYASWEEVKAGLGGVQVGDTVVVKGIKYKVKDNNWWVTTPPPGPCVRRSWQCRPGYRLHRRYHPGRRYEEHKRKE